MIHESDGRPASCQRCAFWAAVLSHRRRGLCRRHAPTRLAADDYIEGAEVPSPWPETKSGDWCGEFEAKP